MQPIPPRWHLVAVKPIRRAPLAPIPDAVFLEPVYRDEEPDERESDGDYDDAA